VERNRIAVYTREETGQPGQEPQGGEHCGNAEQPSIIFHAVASVNLDRPPRFKSLILSASKWFERVSGWSILKA